MTTQEILTLAIAMSISVIVIIIARQMSTSKKSSDAYNVTIYKPKKRKKLDTGKEQIARHLQDSYENPTVQQPCENG